jgi:hypothetical protein
MTEQERLATRPWSEADDERLCSLALKRMDAKIVNRPFNCDLVSRHFLPVSWHGGSACPVAAGRGCGDGASAADLRLLAGHRIDLAC